MRHLTCMRQVWHLPDAFRSSLISGATVGLILLTLIVSGAWYVNSTAPAPTEIVADWPGNTKYQLIPRSSGGYWLDLHLRADPAPDCHKIAEHLLYQDTFPRPWYFPLAANISGADMGKQPTDIGKKLDFYVRLLIPIDFDGRWNYVFRADFRCWPGGLVVHGQSTDPIEMDFPKRTR